MLNDDFSSKTDPSIITPTVPDLVHQSNKIRWVFPVLKSKTTSCPSTVSCRSDWSLEANSSCCHKSDTGSIFELSAVSSTKIAILQMIPWRGSLMYNGEGVEPRLLIHNHPTISINYWKKDKIRVLPCLKFGKTLACEDDKYAKHCKKPWIYQAPQSESQTY